MNAINTTMLWALCIALLANGALFWLGRRLGRIQVVREGFDVVRARARALRPPLDILHMATQNIPRDVEARIQEALAIVHGDVQARPTVDHLTALILLHRDAMDHYDRLGDLNIGHRAAIKRLESVRDALARWIAEGVHIAAAREAEIDRFTRQSQKPIITIASVGKGGELHLGVVN